MDEFSIIKRKIQHKIAQLRIKMKETMERAVTDRLWSQIETLNWVMNEILSLRRKPYGDYGR
jgi:hypothetical protein